MGISSGGWLLMETSHGLQTWTSWFMF